jgi:hypothetical protein
MDDQDCPVKDVGTDLFEKEGSYDRLAAWAREDPENTIALFADNINGPKADELRKTGVRVIGAGGFCDKLENDRVFGFQVAEEIGLKVPGYKGYDSLTEGIMDCQGREEGGVFKSDKFLEADATQVCLDGGRLCDYMAQLRDRFHDHVPCIVQDLVGGKGAADYDINRWWDGKEFVGPFMVTMERKRLLADDLGPSTGCALNAVWFDEQPSLASEIDWVKLAEIFTRENAPPCVYAINTRLSDEDGEAYFLEWTPRLGYDSEMTGALLYDSLLDFLWRVASGQGGTGLSGKLAYSTHLSLPPYPAIEIGTMKRTAEGIVIPYTGNLYSPPFCAYGLRMGEWGLECGDPEGRLGIACAVGDDLTKMHDGVMEFVQDLHSTVSKLQARPDGAKAIQADARKLVDLGVDVHAAILKSAKEEAA